MYFGKQDGECFILLFMKTYLALFTLFGHLLLGSVLHTGCRVSRTPDQVYWFDSLFQQGQFAEDTSALVIRETFPIINQLVHTRLEVVPDWQREELEGKAWLTLHPHFYPTDSLTLDAKGFLIHELALVTPRGLQPLTYRYDSQQLHIRLDRTYRRTDTFTVFVHYTARPNLLPEGGGGAIEREKGLYFINADGSNPYLPTQLWTQGETEFSSAWFPTIDKPNMKTTLTLSVTYDTGMVSLSNGLLIGRRDLGNGKRTDTWQLLQPFAPYLVTLVVGPFAVVTDRWQNMEVSYYVEKQYEPYARDIFGRTVPMLEFYSRLLGVPYPWPKYAQVVVRNFVSGAMENVTATTHGSFLHQTRRELIDGNHDDIIAHELFHHWFGNLVTTESWSHLTINESFATYGEYLWNEHFYGADAADHGLHGDLQRYLSNPEYYSRRLVRYDYDNPNDMFDAVSYSKGGCILHLLRRQVGDEAFFEALRLFLTRHRYGTAEANDLRRAFEDVTGRDLQVFFYQWFYAAGHPELIITPHWDAGSGLVQVEVRQTQDAATGLPAYVLPLTIDVYLEDTVLRFYSEINRRHQMLALPCNRKPLLVNVDADKALVGVKTVNLSDSAFAVLYRRGPLYRDRLEAVEYFSRDRQSPLHKQILYEALNDRFWALRQKAITALAYAADDDEQIAAQLRLMAATDPHPSVRRTALEAIYAQSVANDMALLEFALTDSSYQVVAAAVRQLARRDAARALRTAAQLEAEPSDELRSAIYEVYADKGDADKLEWLTSRLLAADRYLKYSWTESYGHFLQRHLGDSTVLQPGVSTLAVLALNEPFWYIRYAAVLALISLTTDPAPQGGNNPNASPQMLASAAARVEAVLEQVRHQETDHRILMLLTN